jgi:ELWxxDGT repeat protein
MVKDINPGSHRGSEPESLTNVGGTLYFTAIDGVHGRELWMSDGTDAGTILVKDIDPDERSHFGPEYLTNVGGTLFFTADDRANGRELWKSNGNSESTVLVKIIDPDTSDHSGPEDLFGFDGTLFFVADDGEHGKELWMSDGTLAGTVLVRDLSPGLSSSSPSLLTQFRGDLYFHAYASGSVGLFKSNGTEAGTLPVADVSPRQVTVVGQSLFLCARDSAGGYELWRSNGTAAGTVPVKDIWRGGATSYLSELTDFNGRCLFAATNMDYGNELWLSDGTEAGTYKVKDIHTLGNLGSNPSLLTNYQSTLYFWVASGEPGLWKSDGSVSGTERVVNQTPPTKMIQYDDMLCYVSRGRLCASDGTTSGTYDWFKGTGFHDDGISQFTPFKGVTDTKEIIYFSIKDRLYKTCDNGDCVLVKKINTSWWDPIEDMTTAYQDENAQSGNLFFTAHTGGFFQDRELFVSDGTLDGTKLVKDIGGSDNADPQNLTNVNGICYFHASDGNGSSEHGRELWKSDGTAAGTVMVKDVTPGRQGTDFGQFVAGKGQLYFIAEKVIWTSNGTAEGTYPLVHFAVDDLTLLGHRIFFVGKEAAHRGEAWISDGTLAGTFPLKEIVSDFDGLSVQNLTRSDDRIIMTVNGFEIWETDGTSERTRFLGSVYNSAVRPPDHFVSVQNDLFFTVTDVEHGNELWKIGNIDANVLSRRN